MTLRDRSRYHQLHPAKLLADWTAAIAAGIFLWRRQPLPAVAVGFLPSLLVTAAFLFGKFDASLDRIRSRPLARAIAPQLSAEVNALRFAGLAVAWAGCWLHRVWLLPAGIAVILGGWGLAGRRGTANPGA